MSNVRSPNDYADNAPRKGEVVTNNGPYTVKAAAEKLGLTEQRVRQMCQSGELDGAYKQEKKVARARAIRTRTVRYQASESEGR